MSNKTVWGPLAVISAAGMLVCGLISEVTVSSLGALYAPEIALPMLTALAMAIRWPGAVMRSSRFRWIMALLAIMLIGYVVSDVVAGTPSDKYLRGWARIIALASDSFCITVLSSYVRWNLSMFWIAVSLATIFQSLTAKIPLYQWKFHYGEGFAVLVTHLATLLPLWISGLLAFLAGGLNIVLDYRSLGAALILVGVIVGVRSMARRAAKTATIATFVVAVVLSAGAVAYLLNSTGDEFAQRREWSNITRMSGIRAGTAAVLNSPLIGYGSWGQGTEEFAEKAYRESLPEMMATGGETLLNRDSEFLAHSQILQAWMEGGILAAAFFFVYGWWLWRTFYSFAIVARPDSLLPFMLLIVVNNMWNLFMSPFLGNHRFYIASAIAVITLAGFRGAAPARTAMEARPNAPRFLNLMR